MTGIVSYLYSAISSCWNAATVNDKDELTFDSPGRRDAAHGDKGERCVAAADCAEAQDEGRADIPERVAEKDRGMWRSAMHKIFSETGAGTLNLQAYREGIRELHPDTRKLLRESVEALMAERPALNTFRARELSWEIEKVDIEMVKKDGDTRKLARHRSEKKRFLRRDIPVRHQARCRHTRCVKEHGTACARPYSQHDQSYGAVGAAQGRRT